MAGLALLLAVNIALKTPFILFDETDAFLVTLLYNYKKKKNELLNF